MNLLCRLIVGPLLCSLVVFVGLGCGGGIDGSVHVDNEDSPEELEMLAEMEAEMDELEREEEADD